MSFVRTWSTFRTLFIGTVDYVNFKKLLDERWPSTASLPPDQWLQKVYPALAFPYGSMSDGAAIGALSSMLNLSSVSVAVRLCPIAASATTGLTFKKLAQYLEIHTGPSFMGDFTALSLVDAFDSISAEHSRSLLSHSQPLTHRLVQYPFLKKRIESCE